jgi:hypothetical protein
MAAAAGSRLFLVPLPASLYNYYLDVVTRGWAQFLPLSLKSGSYSGVHRLPECRAGTSDTPPSPSKFQHPLHAIPATICSPGLTTSPTNNQTPSLPAGIRRKWERNGPCLARCP